MADEIIYRIKVDDKGTPQIVKFGAASKKAGKEAESAFASASKSLKSFGEEIPGVSGALGTFGKGPAAAAGVAVGALAVGFGAMVKKSIDFADNMNDLSLRLGVSTERLSVLKLYADQSGTSIEDLATAMGRLGVKMSSGDADLKRYGITASTVDEGLFQLADKIAATEDPMLRLKIATDAFGKSGQTMLPLLVQGGAALREMSDSAPIVSQELATMADGFNDKMAEFQSKWVSVSLAITSEVLPALTSMLDMVTKITDETTKFGGFSNVARVAVAAATGNYAGIAKGIYGVATRDTRTETEKAIGAMSGQSGVYRGEPLVRVGGFGAGAAPKATKKRAAIAGTEVDVQELFGNMGTSVDASQFEDPDYYANLKLSPRAIASIEKMEDRRRDMELAHLEQIKQDHQNAYNSMAQGMSSAFASAFDDIWRDGRNVFGALWDSFSELFTQRVIQSFADLAASSLMNAFAPGSGAIASLLFSARGNEVGAGVPSVVGERRAETIVPRGPVRVEPTASAAGTVVINVQNPAQAMSIKRQIEREDRRRTRGIR